MDDPIWCFPWFTPKSQRIKLLSCKNLIEYYLGNYIKDPKLSLDQISVNVYKGTGTVSNVILDCRELTKMSTKQNWPVEITDGRMENITVRVPWTQLFKHDTIFEVSGLSLTVQPAVPKSPVSTILKWVFPRCATKKHKVEDKQNKNVQNEVELQETSKQPTDFFADGINSIMRRLKVSLVNTRIRFEHIPKDFEQGIAFIIKINKIEYFDDATSEPIAIETDSSKKYVIDTYPKKKIKFEGLSVFTEKIPKNDNDPGGTPTNGMRLDNSYLFDEHDFHALPLKDKLIKKIASVQQQNYDDKETLEPELTAILKGYHGSITYEYRGQFEAPKCEAQINGPFIINLSENQLDYIIEFIDVLRNASDKR